ncbi:MAG TPA: sulfotransferase [Solirubrobacteraceae bacterium]|nr:sulfotransferase [Solirubrobacteraceae bacterium]
MKILYVGGYPRSGSTLLSRVLGEHPGSFCAGETRYLWERALMHGVDCGCGVPFAACPLWGEVGERAFGGWERVDAAVLTELDRRTNLPQTLPLHLAPRAGRAMGRMFDEYVPVLARLYEAIRTVAGARVVVEMSKDPTFACLLRRIPGAEVRVVHLVRDSRAVAYSWTRRRRMPSPIGKQEFMPRSTPTQTAVRWSAWNAGFHALRAAGFPYMKLPYERFVEDPRGALEQLSAFAGEPLLPPGGRLTDGEVELGAHHMFSGNPMRAKGGRVAIRRDEEWREHLEPAAHRRVTALTWPLLLAYGYELRTAGRAVA